MNGRTQVLAVVCLLAACGGATNTGGGGSIIPNDDAGGGSSGVNCERLCATQATAMCPGFTTGTCVSQCNNALARVPDACRSSLQTVLRCGYTATFSCSSGGNPTTMACQSEAMAFTACVSPSSPVDASVPRDGG